MKRLALALALAALTAQPVAGQEGPRIAHQPSSRTPFSAAIQVGNTYWLSGKLGANRETRAMTDGRVAAETHNIMRSFGELLVLAVCAASALFFGFFPGQPLAWAERGASLLF